MTRYDQRGQTVYDQTNAQVVNRTTHIVYIGQVIQERERTTPKVVQMREVRIDLKLQNRNYPTQRWVEKISAPGVWADQNREAVNEVWEPENYSYETIKVLLMKE